MILNIKGDIVNDDVKRAVNWLNDNGWLILGDYFAPMDLKAALETMPKGDRLQVKINSGGGDLEAGVEIYSLLKARNDVDIEVQSIAASAASLIAMAGPSTISPAGMIMIHDVSINGVSGNHQDMEKYADILKSYDKTLATAYSEKTGRSEAELTKLMDEETWLPAKKAVALGFIDEFTADSHEELAASAEDIFNAHRDIMELYTKAMKEKSEKETRKQNILKDLDKFGE